MSTLKEEITSAVQQAMRAREKQRLAALRLIQAAIKQKEVDERVALDDAQLRSILNKMAKQHADSIEQFAQAGRDDLVRKEQFELNVIQEFLPKPLADDALQEMVVMAIDKVGASSIKDMGKVMPVLQAMIQGRADMGKVSLLVRQQLS